MEEITKKIKDAYNDDIFDSNALNYQINGFFDAIGLDLSNIEFEKKGFFTQKNSDNKVYYSDLLEARDDDGKLLIYDSKLKRKRWLRLEGDYPDLKYSFVLYYKKSVLNNDDAFLPFKIYITRYLNGIVYDLVLWSEYFITQVVLTRREGKDNKVSYFTIGKVDIDTIFRIIMKYMEKPQELYDFYALHSEKGPFLFGGKYDVSRLDDIKVNAENGKKLEKVLK